MTTWLTRWWGLLSRFGTASARPYAVLPDADDVSIEQVALDASQSARPDRSRAIRSRPRQERAGSGFDRRCAGARTRPASVKPPIGTRSGNRVRALQWVWDNGTWLFSGVGVAALSALITVWRRKRARRIFAGPPIRHPHAGLEVKPVHYLINLTRAVPDVEVELLAINYLSRPIALREVKITRLSAGSLPVLDNIPLAHEVTLEPRSSLLVYCTRPLADAEARAAATARHHTFGGAVSIVVRGMVRGKEVSYGPATALKIDGTVLRNPGGPPTNV